MVPYRWMFRTIIPNILWTISDFFHGLYNIIRWVPVIWNDRDFDWAYLAKVMEYKLGRMSGNFKEYGCHVGNEKDVRRMMVCAELLNRLRTEKHDTLPVTRHNIKYGNLRDQYYQEYLGKMIGKHLRCWWN